MQCVKDLQIWCFTEGVYKDMKGTQMIISEPNANVYWIGHYVYLQNYVRQTIINEVDSHRYSSRSIH